MALSVYVVIEAIVTHWGQFSRFGILDDEGVCGAKNRVWITVAHERTAVYKVLGR